MRTTYSHRCLITKTCLYNFDPLEPHFYIEKLGLTGVYIIFIFAQNIDCGYSLEPPHRGGSNEYPQSIVLSRNMKNIRFLSKYFLFLEVKISIYLNSNVFVMLTHLTSFVIAMPKIYKYKYIYSALNIYNNVYSLHNIQVRTLHSYSTMFNRGAGTVAQW